MRTISLESSVLSASFNNQSQKNFFFLGLQQDHSKNLICVSAVGGTQWTGV